MSEQPTKAFHLGDILSVTTERLCAPIGGLYELLNWMTGDNLMTHQLPRANNECAPELRRQHPDLGDIEMPEDLEGEGPVNAWLAEQVATYGETRPVAPLQAGDHTQIHPLVELKMMRPDMKIIGVQLPGEPA